jgi:hypothetical protein
MPNFSAGLSAGINIGASCDPQSSVNNSGGPSLGGSIEVADKVELEFEMSPKLVTQRIPNTVSSYLRYNPTNQQILELQAPIFAKVLRFIGPGVGRMASRINSTNTLSSTNKDFLMNQTPANTDFGGLDNLPDSPSLEELKNNTYSGETKAMKSVFNFAKAAAADQECGFFKPSLFMADKPFGINVSMSGAGGELLKWNNNNGFSVTFGSTLGVSSHFFDSFFAKDEDYQKLTVGAILGGVLGIVTAAELAEVPGGEKVAYIAGLAGLMIPLYKSVAAAAVCNKDTLLAMDKSTATIPNSCNTLNYNFVPSKIRDYFWTQIKSRAGNVSLP